VTFELIKKIKTTRSEVCTLNAGSDQKLVTRDFAIMMV